MWRINSLENTLLLENIEGRRRREQQRMRWLDDITNSVNMGMSQLLEIVKDGETGVLQSMRSQRVRHDWANELNWTELKSKRPQVKPLFSINFSCFSSDPLGVEIIVYLSGNNCISKFFANIMPSYLKPCITDGLPSLGSLRDASCLKTPVRLSGLIIHILSLFI